MLLRFEPGTFHVHGADCIAFAYGLFPHMALTNHACSPNCVATFQISPGTSDERAAGGGGAHAVLELKALEDIEDGAELVHCYVDIMWPVWARQQRLKYGYNFVCRCPRCEGPRDQDLQLCGTPRGRHVLGDGAARLLGGPSVDKATQAAVSEIRLKYMQQQGLAMAVPDKVRDMDLVQSATFEAEALETDPLQAAKLWRASLDLRARHAHPLHLSLAHARRRAADAAEEAGAWDFAADCWEGVCSLRRQVLPRLHPQLPVALVRLAAAQRKAASLAGAGAESRRRAGAAVAALREAVGALEGLYGAGAARPSYACEAREELAAAEVQAESLGCVLPPRQEKVSSQAWPPQSGTAEMPPSVCGWSSRGEPQLHGMELLPLQGALDEMD